MPPAQMRNANHSV